MISLDRLKPETQRTLALAVPAAVLLLAAVLIAPKALELRRTGCQLETCRTVTALRKQQNLMELAAEGRQRLAAMPQTRDEPLAFLRELNRIVALAGVRLVSYKPPAPAGGGPGATAPAAGMSAVVRPIGCEVTVSGSFAHQVSLFRRLARSERLFTVENLQVRVEEYPRLSASFRIVRYATPVPVSIAHAQGASLVRTASARAASESPDW